MQVLVIEVKVEVKEGSDAVFISSVSDNFMRSFIPVKLD
jgi:hypothetical protein